MTHEHDIGEAVFAHAIETMLRATIVLEDVGAPIDVAAFLDALRREIRGCNPRRLAVSLVAAHFAEWDREANTLAWIPSETRVARLHIGRSNSIDALDLQAQLRERTG